MTPARSPSFPRASARTLQMNANRGRSSTARSISARAPAGSPLLMRAVPRWQKASPHRGSSSSAAVLSAMAPSQSHATILRRARSVAASSARDRSRRHDTVATIATAMMIARTARSARSADRDRPGRGFSNVASARARAVPSGKRSPGRRARARARTAWSSRGTSARPMGSTVADATRASVSTRVPGKAGLPERHSWRIAPRANTSDGGPTDRASSTCSGDM